MAYFVKETFTYTFGNGNSVLVPAGARTQSASVHGDVDFRWLDPSVYPRNSIAWHDAEYYGVRVPLSNTEEA